MQDLKKTEGYRLVKQWMQDRGNHPFIFQEETWQHILNGSFGLVNAPTGCGKTFSVFLGAIIDFINRHPDNFRQKKKNGLQLLWVTPLRALAVDIGRAMEEVIEGLGLSWKVGIRNGDTSINERKSQKTSPPEILIITPESLHLLLAQKHYPQFFQHLKIIAVDEWHELLGSKRGVQVELAISRLVGLKPSEPPLIWGISATIGNLREAGEVLMAPLERFKKKSRKHYVLVKAEMHKRTEIASIFPDEIETYPWAGHLGLKLIHKIIPVIMESRTTLLFINTRGMSEVWYQELLNVCPDLAGAIALHHGSVDPELRQWVEENLHTGKLKLVVCTSSLDLGVDFRPVETVIQVGSPKGVARFLQRAGRSGHGPGEISRIYFVPTHSLELVEAAALKEAMEKNDVESRQPMILCYDVLIQYLGTLAISEGFVSEEIFREVKSTYCFSALTAEEWEQLLFFLTKGGNALEQYDEYKKVEFTDGRYRMTSRRMAMRHRMHIGTIVSDPMLKVKLMGGKYIGVIEEWFISRLEPGAVFSLAGRNLEYVMIKDMTVIARKSNSAKSIVPSWMGGRMSLTSNLGDMLRKMIHKVAVGKEDSEELKRLQPLFQLQQELSIIPKEDELLIEHIETKDGYHVFVYPFEGRLVHEAIGALIAYRLSRITPLTFSIAMNDYGFELLCDQPIPLDDSNAYELFSTENLLTDIERSVNSVEMARRKFRDIAVIGGLIFQGYPGEHKKARHLQASASLLFQVFSEYEPDNLLVLQAYQEVMEQQMEEARLRSALERIRKGKIKIVFPERLTPFSFPLKVDSLRQNLSSESLGDRVRKMLKEL